MFIDGEFVQKEQLGSGGESTEEVTEEEALSAEEEAEFEAALAEENGEVISDRMKSVRNEDISDVDEAELDEIDFEIEDTSTIDTPGKKLRDINESFSRIAKAIDPKAEPVAVDTQRYAIPAEVALYCTVAAAQSSVGTVAEDLSKAFNGTNMKPLAQAKEIWNNTPAEKRADLLIHGVARLSQMAAEPIGLDREMIMSGLVIGNTLKNLQGPLRQEVINKLQGNSRDMVLGAQELGEIGYGGLLANQYLQNPKMSSELSQVQRQEMITSALVYEAVGQEMDHRNVSRSKNGMPIPSSLQPVLGRENGLKALHSSVEQYEKKSAGGSLYSMDLNTLAQTMQNRDKLRERVLPLQREKSSQNVQSAPQKNTQRTKEKKAAGIVC
ncbi:MAG: hypothetical protein ACI4FX_12665 [Agathobacter sp.]